MLRFSAGIRASSSKQFSSSIVRSSQISSIKQRAPTAIRVRHFSTGVIAKATPRQLIEEIEGPHGVSLLDVRPAQDYKAMRITGSISIPLENLEEKAPLLVKDHKIFVHCDKVRCCSGRG